jgi:hypothetical protein
MADRAQSEAVFPKTSESGLSGVRATVQRAWWLALGVLATVGQQTTRLAGALVEKGSEVEPSVLEPVRRAAARVCDATEGAGTRLRGVVGKIGDLDVPGLRRVAGPTKEEFERLVDEVKDLRARLGDRIEKAADREDRL